MNKKKLLMTIAIGVGIEVVALLLATLSFTYSWFSATVTEKDVKDQVVETGTLSLRYVDGPEIKMENIRPGTTITKTVYVANTGTLDASYNLVWQELTNEIENDEMVIEATCTRLDGVTEEESGTCTGISSKPVSSSIIKSNVSIEPNILHKYDITITFIETKDNQNYNQGKSFSGVLGVNEYKQAVRYCTYDGDLTPGAEFTDDTYTYRYMQMYTNLAIDNSQLSSNNDEYKASFMVTPASYGWKTMTNNDGWGVKVTNEDSTDAIIEAPCTYINSKPIIAMSYMFVNSLASSIDVSKFNTGNVLTMNHMFYYSEATEIKGLENLDTSKVIDMQGMFYNSNAESLDGIENFNTSNVTTMEDMFYSTQTTILDVSGFDTSNVTTMEGMFTGISASEIKGLDKFNTSNVTNMSGMFQVADNVEVLDVSSFDTSKVTNMDTMFASCSKLKTIYASDKFVTTNAGGQSMFESSTSLEGGAGTKLSYTDKTYARIDGGTTKPGYFTAKPN